MFPILLRLHGVAIYSYGVLVAAGLVVGWGYARLRAPRAGLDPDRIWTLGAYATLVGLATARLWLIVSSPHYFRLHPEQMWSLNTLQDGGTFYGGLFGALLTMALYSRRHKMPALLVTDTCAPGLALGHAIGRIGCFAVGCCYGKPTQMPWAVTFSSETARRLSGVPLNVPLHPTQLYDAAAELLNFFVLSRLPFGAERAGHVTGAYLVLYGIERALIECFRGDPGRTLLWQGRISLMQLVSFALITCGAALLVRNPPRSAVLHAR